MAPPMDEPMAVTGPASSSASSRCTSCAISPMVYGPSGVPLSPQPRLSNTMQVYSLVKRGIWLAHEEWSSPSPATHSSGGPLPVTDTNRLSSPSLIVTWVTVYLRLGWRMINSNCPGRPDCDGRDVCSDNAGGLFRHATIA